MRAGSAAGVRGLRAIVRSDRLQWALMLAPSLLGLGLLFAVPAALAGAVAFTDFDAIRPPRWAGLDNFLRLARDPDFWNGLRASLVFVALAVPLRVAGALALALFLYRPRRGAGLVRAAVCVPTIVPDVAYALLWLYLLDPLYGPLHGLSVLITGYVDPRAVALGRVRPTGWLIDPTAAQAAIVLMSVWTLAEGFILLMAALQAIPRVLHEQATIDGAGPWQRFAHVLLPMLLPLMGLVALRDTVFSFQANFLAAVIITKGGPYYATSYLPYWIYLNAAEYQRYGYAAAMNLALILITAGIIGLQLLVVRRWQSGLSDG